MMTFKTLYDLTSHYLSGLMLHDCPPVYSASATLGLLWFLGHSRCPLTPGICARCSLSRTLFPDTHMNVRSHSLQVLHPMPSVLKRTSLATLSKISHILLILFLCIIISPDIYHSCMCVHSLLVCLSFPPLNHKLCEDRDFYPFCPLGLQVRGTIRTHSIQCPSAKTGSLF